MSYTSDQLSQDIIHDPNFQIKITNFVHTLEKRPPFTVVAQLFTDLLQSKVLQIIAMYPDDVNNAYACLTQLVRSPNSRIPSVFPAKFIALARTPIEMVARPGNTGSHLYLAKIQVNNIKPTTVLTNFSMNTITNELMDGVNRMVTYSEAHNLNPNAVQLPMSNKNMDEIVNTMMCLKRTIADGYRKNGYEPDEYINQKPVIPKKL